MSVGVGSKHGRDVAPHDLPHPHAWRHPTQRRGACRPRSHCCRVFACQPGKGAICFADLRDGTGMTQVFAKADTLGEDQLSLLQGLTRESTLTVTGTVAQKRPPKTKEGEAPHLPRTKCWPARFRSSQRPRLRFHSGSPTPSALVWTHDLTTVSSTSGGHTSTPCSACVQRSSNTVANTSSRRVHRNPHPENRGHGHRRRNGFVPDDLLRHTGFPEPIAAIVQAIVHERGWNASLRSAPPSVPRSTTRTGTSTSSFPSTSSRLGRPMTTLWASSSACCTTSGRRSRTMQPAKVTSRPSTTGGQAKTRSPSRSSFPSCLSPRRVRRCHSHHQGTRRFH